ncbi:MAG TPA: glycosyltransferase [Acetobacteraceae bacterium]|nr:glycosyltransferase [Acetobacteraceae bacterium]
MNVMLGRGLGGLEQALLDYAVALTQRGHEVHTVIHPDAALRPALEARLGAPHTLAHAGAWDPLAAARLHLLLRRLRPDISIAHGNRAVSLLRLAGASPIGAVLGNYKINCSGLAAAFCPTLDLKRHAAEQGMAPSCAYHVPYMVDVPPAPPQRGTRVPPVIGTLGRFVAKKGFDVFLAALGRLRSNGILFRAVLAGDGPERGALERLAADNGLRDVLNFPGWVTDKAEFFAGIDLFCLPSQHEPFGIVLIEAMAHAVPVVATDSEGPTEILCDGIDGLVVPRSDPGRMAQALGTLIADPAEAKRRAASAYRQVLLTYDVPRVGERIDDAVQETVRRARSLRKTG